MAGAVRVRDTRDAHNMNKHKFTIKGIMKTEPGLWGKKSSRSGTEGKTKVLCDLKALPRERGKEKVTKTGGKENSIVAKMQYKEGETVHTNMGEKKKGGKILPTARRKHPAGGRGRRKSVWKGRQKDATASTFVAM